MLNEVLSIAESISFIKAVHTSRLTSEKPVTDCMAHWLMQQTNRINAGGCILPALRNRKLFRTSGSSQSLYEALYKYWSLPPVRMDRCGYVPHITEDRK